MADSRLIAALDFHTMREVEAFVELLGDSVCYYKVGMELFYSAGSQVITYLKSQDKDIFLDLKLHDIPNTVADGLCSLMRLGATMLNVHASGGYTMMKTAADRVREEAQRLGIPRPRLIAVTILTSINDDDWQGLGQTASIGAQVVRLARLAQAAGPMVRVIQKLSQSYPRETFEALSKYEELADLLDALKAQNRKTDR